MLSIVQAPSDGKARLAPAKRRGPSPEPARSLEPWAARRRVLLTTKATAPPRQSSQPLTCGRGLCANPRARRLAPALGNWNRRGREQSWVEVVGGPTGRTISGEPLGGSATPTLTVKVGRPPRPTREPLQP